MNSRLWPSVEQIRGDEFLPANRIDVTVRCFIQKSGDVFYFNYSVSSDRTSKQIISDVYISGLEDTTSNLAPPMWQSGSSSYIGGRAFIKYSAGTYYLIHPGQTMGGFKTISPALPTIVNYYVQGYTQPIFVSADQETQNILNNSVTGRTVGTRDTSVMVDALQWLDTLTSYTTQSRSLGWIKDQATAHKYSGYFTSAKTSLQQNNTNATRATLHQVLQQVNIDSTNNMTSEAYALIRYNTEYLLTQIPTSQAGFIVKLISSTGTRFTTGSLQYYEASWKDATNNNDGTFSITTTAKTLSLRMTYEYGTQTKSNVTVGSDTAVFQTVNVQVQLKNSQGNFLDTGSVQYYAGVWRNLGITSNGVASKELLPNAYSFRMTYAGGSNDKQQDIGANPTVVFQTVNTTVQLKNSQGNLIDTGTVQYYAGAWRSFGTTTGGVTTNELLPNNYSFRMTYEGISNDKAQDISTNGTVAKSTVLCTVRVKDSQGQPVNNIQASYYSGAWRQIGPTVNGQVTKELLPANLTFRITYGTSHQDKTQNLSTSSVVEFNIP